MNWILLYYDGKRIVTHMTECLKLNIGVRVIIFKYIQYEYRCYIENSMYHLITIYKIHLYGNA